MNKIIISLIFTAYAGSALASNQLAFPACAGFASEKFAREGYGAIDPEDVVLIDPSEGRHTQSVDSVKKLNLDQQRSLAKKLTERLRAKANDSLKTFMDIRKCINRDFDAVFSLVALSLEPTIEEYCRKRVGPFFATLEHQMQSMRQLLALSRKGDDEAPHPLDYEGRWLDAKFSDRSLSDDQFSQANLTIVTHPTHLLLGEAALTPLSPREAFFAIDHLNQEFRNFHFRSYAARVFHLEDIEKLQAQWDEEETKEYEEKRRAYFGEKRMSYLRSYFELLKENPLLVFLTTHFEKVSELDSKNDALDLAIEKLEEAAEEIPYEQTVDNMTEIYPLLRYSYTVNEVLKDHPNLCQQAESLVSYHFYKPRHDVFGLPVLVAKPTTGLVCSHRWAHSLDFCRPRTPDNPNVFYSPARMVIDFWQ